MDLIQTQPTQTSNLVTDDYLVTQQVNTASIPQNQIKNDLDALKSAEDFMTGKLDIGLNTLLSDPQPTSSPILQPVQDPNQLNQPQELIALKLKNPFRGE